jgi:cytochrome P450
MGAALQTAYSRSLSESEVVHNFTAILMAGFDTVSRTLCVVIWLVFIHEHTHAALAAELQGAFEAQEDITLDIARKLPWLNAVITEALRVFPPIPVGPPRVSPGAYVDNIYIPAGVSLDFISIVQDHIPFLLP